MIDIEKTIKEKGYNPNDLSKWSKKKIWAVCDDCNKGRWISFYQYVSLCKQCKFKYKGINKEKNNIIFSKYHDKEIEITFNEKGYNIDYLSYGSAKKIYAICDKCKIGRWVEIKSYRILCKKCIQNTERIRKIKSKTHKGIKHSKKTKEKISLGNKGKIISKEIREKTSKTMTGIKRSKKTKEKMSKSKSGENNYLFGKFGKEHPSYNFDLTNEERLIKREYPEYKEWRTAVYKRDNYMCQLCGMPDNLISHHIESYNSNKELRTTLSNGITLCEDCHKDFHHQYGNGNNTLEQFKKYVKGRVY